MKSLRLSIFVILFAACLAPAAFAWPACSGNWNQVPAGTSSANGTIYTADGITWQCQKPSPTPTPTPTTNNNQNTNTNQNTQGQNQGQSQGQSQGQTANGGNATATGGNSSSTSGVKNSGNSTVNTTVGVNNKLSNMGNSSNTNNNTANGGAGGQGGQGGAGGTASSNQTQSNSSTNQNQSSASNQANGNGSNSNNTTNNVEAAKIPVATAFAPTALPTVQCFKGYSGGAQSAAFGFSLGGGKIDENCAILETARSFAIHGSDLAYCMTMVTNKYAKKAGVTVEQCMQMREAPAPVISAAPQPVMPALPPINLQLALPVSTPAPSPVPYSPYLGFFTNVSNVTKAKLDDIVMLSKVDADSHLRLRAGASSMTIVDGIVSYLASNGVDRGRIEVRDDGDSHGVEALWIKQ